MSHTQKNFAPRKEKLIQIALNQFLDNGYENTTITDLQKAFGSQSDKGIAIERQINVCVFYQHSEQLLPTADSIR